MRALKLDPNAARRRRHAKARRAGMARVIVSLAVLLGGGTGTALACSRNGGGTTPNHNYYQAYNGNLMQIAVPPGRSTFPLPAYPVAGEILFSAEVMLPNFGDGSGRGIASPLYDCKAGAIEEFRGGGARISGYDDLYASGVPGIGYRVYYYIRDSEAIAAPVMYVNEHKSGALVFPFNGSSDMGSNLKTRIEFVATGEPISPGMLTPANIYGQATVSNTSGVTPNGLLYRVYLATPVQITPPTCDISNLPALTVRLPSVPAHFLMRGDGRDITSTALEVACTSPSELSPTITVTANYPVGGYAATLSNQETGAEAAQGVGVQMWLFDPADGAYRNPAFGAAQEGIGSPMEGLPSSRWRFVVGASYLPIAPTVVAGRVRASATLKFTYL